MTTSKSRALKESVLDTLFATVLNIPINFVLAYIAVQQQWTATQITFYFTGIFFLIAVYRKYKIRLYFENKHNDSE